MINIGEKPHILMIQSDQHHPFIGGYAGDPYVSTPNLDALANNGVVFERCYCNSPLCVPSRSSMLTGRLPVETGVYNNLQCLRSDQSTFATSLAIAGYDTVLAGRMHFTGYDQHHGFEKRLVGDLNPTFPRPERQKKLYGPLAGTPDQSRVAIEKSGAGSSAMLCYDRAVTDAACQYLRDRKDDRNLFMLVGYGNPHCPFIAPKDLYRKYFEKLPRIDMPLEEHHPAIQQFIELRGIQHVSSDELHRIRSAYYANVEYMDGLIGEVVRCARKTLGENLVIIYLSDHGECLGSHGLFWKSNFYEESVHVPLIISAPSRFTSARRNSSVVSLVDIAPTLIDLAGATHLPSECGHSMLPLLRKGIWEHPNVAISMLSDIKGDLPSAMILSNQYKLIKYCTIDLPMLFNLENDPGEANNLAAVDEYSNLVQELLMQLHQVWDEDKALKLLQEAKEQAQMLRSWTKATHPESIDEWQSTPEMNFLEPEI